MVILEAPKERQKGQRRERFGPRICYGGEAIAKHSRAFVAYTQQQCNVHMALLGNKLIVQSEALKHS